MNEINVSINQEAGIIKCDLASVKTYLDEQLEIYRNMVFTEETKKDAKTSVAELRKGKKALQDNIKEAKAVYMKPWEAFNAEATVIVNMFDEPIDVINEQITEFENKRKEEKREQIAEAYAEILEASDVAEYVTLQKVYNSRWENATMTINQVKSEMCEIKIKIKTALDAIKGMGSDAEQDAINTFFINFDLAEAMQVISRYEANKKAVLERELERQRQAEAERIRAEERAKIEAEAKAEREKAEAVAQAQEEARAETIEMLTPDDDGEALEYTYTLKLTADAKTKVEMYLDSVGIEWEELPPF